MVRWGTDGETAHRAGQSTKKSSGMMEQMASTAVGRSTPARMIGAPVTVLVAVEAAGKLQSTSVISSPCPAERSTCRRSAVRIGFMPFSKPSRAAVAWNGRREALMASGRPRRVRWRVANMMSFAEQGLQELAGCCKRTRRARRGAPGSARAPRSPALATGVPEFAPATTM